MSESHRLAGRLVRHRPRLILLNDPWPLQWSIRRLGAPPAFWTPGFPYWGEASELIESWGLYSRSAVLRVLRDRVGLLLGDELCWQLAQVPGGQTTFYLADLSCGRLHCLRSRV